MSFCQIVVGAPGAGKSTYCNAMQQFMKAIGREAVIVNLDPANESLQYTAALSVTELITVDDVMREHGLGPNGALIFCVEWLEKNMDLLRARLRPFEDKYILFDFPGQAELYTHNAALRSVVTQMQQDWGFRPVAVHLADVHLCADPANFISALLMSLSVMCHLELPHVNVLSKVDLAPALGRLPFRLDFYTEVLDLRFLTRLIDPFHLVGKTKKLGKYANKSERNDISAMHRDSSDNNAADDDDDGEDEDDDAESGDADSDSDSDTGESDNDDYEDNEGGARDKQKKQEDPAIARERRVRRAIRGHRRLNKAIADLIHNYSLVSFRPLSVTDKAAMHRLLVAIDRANGYMFRGVDLATVSPLEVAGVRAGDAFADYASSAALADLVFGYDQAAASLAPSESNHSNEAGTAAAADSKPLLMSKAEKEAEAAAIRAATDSANAAAAAALAVAAAAAAAADAAEAGGAFESASAATGIAPEGAAAAVALVNRLGGLQIHDKTKG